MKIQELQKWKNGDTKITENDQKMYAPVGFSKFVDYSKYKTAPRPESYILELSDNYFQKPVPVTESKEDIVYEPEISENEPETSENEPEIFENANVTKTPSYQPAKCDFCNKIYSKRSNLRAHVKNYHGEVSLIHCNICQKEFKEKSNLKRHILEKHEGIKHQCDLCKKSFTSKYYVKNHKKTAHCDSVEQSD